jgi:hypothetical protein
MPRSSAAYIHDLEKIARVQGPSELLLINVEIVKELASERQHPDTKARLRAAAMYILALAKKLRESGL